MEARSVLENRPQYREANAERDPLIEGLLSPSSKIEMLEKLTLTLLHEIETLKHIRRLEMSDDAHSLSLPDQVRRFEIKLMSRALKHTGGHQARAARLLGIKATTFHSKIKRYRINPNLPGEPEKTGEASDVEPGEGNSLSIEREHPRA